MASAAQLLKEYKNYNVNSYQKAIEDEYNKKTNFNKDLIDQTNATRAESIALPSQLRAEYYNSPIKNALTQESLIGANQANIASRLGAQTDYLNARGQQFSDILGKAIQGYQYNADNAWKLYETQNQNEQQAANRASSRASAGGFDKAYLEKLLKGLGTGNTQNGSYFANAEKALRANTNGSVSQGPIMMGPNGPIPIGDLLRNSVNIENTGISGIGGFNKKPSSFSSLLSRIFG